MFKCGAAEREESTCIRPGIIDVGVLMFFWLWQITIHLFIERTFMLDQLVTFYWEAAAKIAPVLTVLIFSSFAGVSVGHSGSSRGSKI